MWKRWKEYSEDIVNDRGVDEIEVSALNLGRAGKGVWIRF